MRENQRADDLSREERVLRVKCLQCQMLKKNENWQGRGNPWFCHKEVIATFQTAISSRMGGTEIEHSIKLGRQEVESKLLRPWTRKGKEERRQ